jgi:AraC-like DNA-binding protein
MASARRVALAPGVLIFSKTSGAAGLPWNERRSWFSVTSGASSIVIGCHHASRLGSVQHACAPLAIGSCRYGQAEMYRFAAGTRNKSADDPLDVLVREGGKALARQQGVSFRTLRRRFKDRGTTISQARLTRKVSMVVNLLQLKDVTLRDLALRLGYSGAPSFTKFVRREFGVPPGILRRQLQGH